MLSFLWTLVRGIRMGGLEGPGPVDQVKTRLRVEHNHEYVMNIQ